MARFARVVVFCGFLALVGSAGFATPDPRWGKLANPGVTQQRIKTTLFFAGQARDGSAPYGCSPSSNLSLYTVHPSDQRNLNWHSSAGNREFVLDQMISAGVNVINMSTWGEAFLPCTTAWATYAPMQTAPAAHDELFAAAVNKSLLIVPFIESRADWTFRDEFPTWIDGVTAPGTVSQIVELVNRYLKNPSHPEWAGLWARVYNRTGQERYAVAIIQASSNRLSSYDHSAYSAGFDAVAQAVYERTGVRVGFLVDALPRGTSAPGVFKPSPESTGVYLAARDSILGIQCFVPEVWVGSSSDSTLIAWKRDFSSRWAQTGIPFLMDICPGYDAHIVFPGSVQYGLNASWRSALGSMVADHGADGMIYNAWNGYTEALTAVPTTEHGDVCLNWLASLNHVPAITTIAGVKTAPDFAGVSITGTVSAAFYGDSGSGGFCPVSFAVENANRSAGVRVVSGAAVIPGRTVLVRGIALTDQGERVIEASSLDVLGSGEAAKPIAMSNRSTAGGASGAQSAVVDDISEEPDRMSAGVNTVGLRISVSGRVIKVLDTGSYSGFFYIDDGSSLRDGSGCRGIRCRPPSCPLAPSNLPNEGDFVIVTGVMGVSTIDGLNTRYLWTEGWRLVAASGS